MSEGPVSIAASASERGAEPGRERTIDTVSEGPVSIAASASERDAEPGRERTIDTESTETRDLLAAARGGDQAAWDALVARYSGLLWAVARGFRLDTADAGDAVQTTWLRLVENLDRIADPDRLAGWLSTTVRRECLGLLRRAGRERPALDELPEPVDAADPLDAGLLSDERDAALWRALGTLSQRCQRLLRVLSASPPPPYTAVAAALEMPIGSIGPTRRRCLESLRRIADTDDLLLGGAR